MIIIKKENYNIWFSFNDSDALMDGVMDLFPNNVL